MAGGYGQRLRLRLFLEGVEVPVISAHVSVNPNSPAACTIQIPPLSEGTSLMPRTLVHLFFLDLYEAQSPFASPTATNTNTNQSPGSSGTTWQPGQQPVTSTVGDIADLDNARYKLLFGGEVAGFTWSKGQSSRSLVLQCLDWSSYWDSAQQWNNTDLFGPGIKALFSGGSTNLFTDFLEDEGSAILRTIQTPSIRFPKLKGLLGGIVHLLETIGGTYYYKTQIKGDNLFFSIAELRLHITQMITAYDQDPTASRLLSKGYDSLLGRTLGNLGQCVSMRQAINALMSAIFHETYAQCCPLYVPGTGNGPSGQTTVSLTQSPDYAGIVTSANALISSIATTVSSLNAANPYTAPTGSTSLGDQTASTLSSRVSEVNRLITLATGMSVAPVRSYLTSALTSLNSALASTKKGLATLNGLTPSTVVGPIVTSLNQASAQLTKVVSFQIVSTQATTTPAQLQQQIFRPDVWFSAPPCCNVIFPEHYNMLSYSRMFLQEPTRLLLKTNNEFFGEDELFDQFYYAPKGFTIKTGGAELQSMLNNGVLDHELFTGILPVFEKMGELNIFGARSGTVKGKVPKIGLAQRSTNFLYFKYRYAARQMQVSGKFNPYLACGFPALVIDKYVDAATLALRQQLIQQNGGQAAASMNSLLGTHFLCNLTEVSHNVDQTSGTTDLNCSYARTPDEGTEFLGVVRPNQTVQQRAAQDASRTSVVASLTGSDFPAVNTQGPNGGVITAVTDKTQAYKGQTLPLYTGPVIAGTKQPSVKVPVGVVQPVSAYASAAQSYLELSLDLSPTQAVSFRAFQVVESVPRFSQKAVDLPVEEYIRPGWYGDCWHPLVIGQVYQQFFQIGSITDQTTSVGGNGASLPGVNYGQAMAALAQAQKALDADDFNSWASGLLTLNQGSSIADAVAFLVSTYSYIKQNGLSSDDFIRSYTWRPIATMVDMFGTENLTLDPQGISVVQGIEGFHSRAFGPYNNLFGLTPPNVTNALGIAQGSAAAQRADTRLRKQQAVQSYVSALSFARAILG